MSPNRVLWTLVLLLAASSARAQTTFTVNTASDAGTMGCDVTECTLREAIAAANATAGADVIEFAIPGAGPHTIATGALLPAITESLTIDGFTQPGSSPNTNATGALDAVIGVVVTRDSGLGAGVGLNVMSDDVAIRGLAIGGFFNGIIVNAGFQNVIIAGNFIGANAAGTGVLVNSNAGVFVDVGATNVTVGGTLPADRNLISGNTGTANTAGVTVSAGGASSTGVTIAGNLIGTSIGGTSALPNAIGVRVAVAGNGAADAIVIGGSLPEDGNVISGNASHGINVVKTGTLSDPLANQNRIEGNLIGVAVDGVTALANAGNGLWFSNSVSRSHWIVATNVIAWNALAGIQVNASPGTGVGETITQNSIHDNTGLGIDLDTLGANANDVDDGDLGGNDRQNHPVLDEAISDGSATGVFGLLNSVPGGTYTVEIFDNEPGDTPGTEGRTFLGDTVVVTGGPGTSTPFEVIVPMPLAPGRLLTATATNDQGNTSEFSAAIAVQGISTTTVTTTTTSITTTSEPSTTSTSLETTTTSTSLDTTTTSTSTTTSTTVDLCGNGVIDAGEECDTADFGDATCPGSSVVGAFLVCDPDCTIDFSGCPGASTTSTSIPSSTTSTTVASTTSTTIETTTTSTSTTTSTTVDLCGNGVIDAGEECDTSDFGGATCPGSSVVGAFLVCDPDCTIDFSGCPGASTTSTSIPSSTTSTTIPGSTTSTTLASTTSTTTVPTSTSSTTTTTLGSTTSTSSSTTSSTTSSTVASSTTSSSSTSTSTIASSTTTTTSSTTSTTVQIGLVPGGKAPDADCYLELAVEGVTNDGTVVVDDRDVLCMDGTPCDADGLCDNVCTFRVAACINQDDPNVPECTPPAALTSVSVRSKAGTIPLPATLEGSACGAFVDVPVEARFNAKGVYQAKKSRLKLKGKAKAPQGTKPRSDVDGWKLQCLPNDACD